MSRQILAFSALLGFNSLTTAEVCLIEQSLKSDLDNIKQSIMQLLQSY